MSVYLDYAATSAIRPDVVADAVARYLRDIGATPGRSGHRLSLDAGRVTLRCRQAIASLLNIPGDPGRVAFQLNATHALNVALFGMLIPGDAVVRTVFDHNAVRRPLAALARSGIQVRVLRFGVDGRFDEAELEDALVGEGRRARLLVLPHASNVTGVVFPVAEIARQARAHGIPVLLDAAQTAGHYPLDVEELGVDLLAFTGHKALLGPQGTGGLWVRDGVEVRPVFHGGTGGDSAPLEMPATYPDHLEAGSQNGPGFAGLLAGVEWIVERGLDRIRRDQTELWTRLVDGVRRLPSIDIVSPVDGENVGVVSLRVSGYDPAEVAGILDRSHGVQGRAGLHCAPDAHAALGTLESGTFRLSVGWATTEQDIDDAVEALNSLGGERSNG